ncbi:S-layer homology domain-containing protein [Paenibacillus sacheonensis]|uniref:DUF4430 domain-containing protein n=1 Tax=Paenibacillus sacheonensis TaxID=742054 RepID=A0A7X5BVF1_9BACL|nr:S-layer homology domain-containing protein [Paenibacillus sacheonensis]NBC68328.1 DUF4430 domain-containing protein [Paenibacillus sacheonensis]
MRTHVFVNLSGKIGKRWLSVLLAAVLLLSAFVPAGAAYADEADSTTDPLLQQVEAAIEGASQAIVSGAGIGDWESAGLSAAGRTVPSAYVSTLYKQMAGNHGSFYSVTDYERTVIGLTATHQDATKFAGYDLAERIYDYPAIGTLNGLIFALIALDSGHYAVPDNALWTRDKLIAAILARQNQDGGFNWTPSASDPDITGMTLTALAPYKGQEAVQSVIDRAVNWLSVNQLGNGGYASYNVDNSESVSQAIIGLTALGLDPTGADFTKNGHHLVERLLSFRIADGTFSHKPAGASNGIATEQALQALAAFDKYKKDGSRLYDYGVRIPYGWASDWLLGDANGTGISDWQVVGLSREGREVPGSYLSDTLANTIDILNQYPEYALVTDYERSTIALSALHLDATDYAGIDFVERIYNSGIMEDQGINGLDFALIALDAGDYATPGDAKWNRDKIIAAILAKQHDDGGFSLSTGASDPDLTAMTLTALAPYMGRNEVKTAGEKAIQWLSLKQDAHGGGYPTDNWGTIVDSSESVSQAIIALASNGIDPTSAPYTKNGITLIDKLFTFMQPDGGFKHAADPQAPTDVMATEQALQALAAYEMFVDGRGRLYQFGAPVSLQVEGPSGAIAGGGASAGIALDALKKVLDDKRVPVVVTESSYGKYVSAINGIAASGTNGWMFDVNRGGEWSFPGVGMDAFELQRGDKLVVYYGGSDTALVRSVKVEPAAPKAGEAFKVTVMQTASVWNGTSSEVVTAPASGVRVAIGGQSVTTNASGEGAFDSGIGTAGDYRLEVTGYREGSVPSLVRYAQSLTIAAKTSDNGGGNPPTSQFVALSVTGDSRKGTILGSKQVALQTGDTAYSVLARELPGKVRDTGAGATKYVQGIDGLSEFDRGPESGWMYAVNGSFPNYSAGIYDLQPGDVVAWRYTTNLGCDLGAPGGNCSAAGGGSAPIADPVTVVDVPSDPKQDYVHKVTTAEQSKGLQFNIPIAAPRVILNADDVKDALPRVTANKGNLSLVIDKGTKLLSGSGNIELFTQQDPADASLQKLIQGNLIGSDKLDGIGNAFIMGAANGSFLFDKPLTYTIKNGKGQLAGYIENGTFHPITIYGSEEEGAQAAKGSERITYAYVSGNDLIIRSNHFTAYVTYAVKKTEPVDINKQYSDAKLIASWAYGAVGDATGRGFILGSSGQFHPKATMTRAEFAKLMVEVLGLKQPTGPSSSFGDVPSGTWFAPYVNAAYQAGFITGYDGKFLPNETITREQMAAVIVRAFDLKPAALTTPLGDMSAVSTWAQADVRTVAARQIMEGADNRFNPRDSVTREMAVVVAMRAYAVKGDEPNGSQPGTTAQEALRQQIAATAAYQLRTVKNPSVGTLGGEWTVLGLARSGTAVPTDYYARYYANLSNTLREKSGQLHTVKFTEYDRVILALSAIGKGIDNAAGYDLAKPLADFDQVTKQGINGPIFALIALDSKHYEIPAVAGAKTPTTRERLIDYILGKEIKGGGWALGENASAPDADVTGMAIQALAPYDSSRSDVHAAIERALAWLSGAQQADGGFASQNAVNAESAAQVIVALTSLGIDPAQDERFKKNGRTAVDALISFADQGGGFYHVKPGAVGNGGASPGEVDAMATDQAFYALVAYDRLLGGKTSLFDMTDTKLQS